MSPPQESLRRAQETIRQLYEELERTNQEVMALTLELEQRVDALRKENTERKRVEAERQAQVERLKLLNQITHAIGERQDLRSIFQVTVRSLEEHLPLDLACACLAEPAEAAMTLMSAGHHPGCIEGESDSHDYARLQIDTNVLSSFLGGEVVCEPDTQTNPQSLSQQLAKVGLRSFIVAPLRAKEKVFGALVAARRGVDSFSGDERDFVRQLSEQVALAAHQAMLHGALERAYEDMRRTQQVVMQQERLRALGQMAGGIAHDINNALSPASIYVQSILERDTSLSQETRDYLTVVCRALDDVGRTVARMRMFYRPREPEAALSALDLNRLSREVIELTRARWNDIPQERGIIVSLEADLARELPPIKGAENEIRDALTNLVLNAVDAMPAGGTLRVRSGLSPGPPAAGPVDGPALVFVEVADTGVGMTEEVRSRCLEPFFSTKGERGTGLGLAMVYGMARRHGAELEIESVHGKGTLVRLIFPVAAQSKPRREVALARLTPVRILLVDDDPLLLKSLRDVLHAEGHAVTAADGGQRGIEEFMAARERGESFAVVITDLGMPNVNGRAVAAAIKAVSREVAVILLTGWGQRLNDESELPENVDCLLGKPPRLAELRAALAAVVAGGGA